MVGQIKKLSLNQLIVTVFAAFLLGGIGTMVLFSVLTAGEDSHLETFDVDNQFVDKDCVLSHSPKGDMVVRYYNSVTWVTLTTSDYTVSGNTVTVDADAMD